MPTLGQMSEEGSPFTGFLYAGLVLTPAGPQVLEFNVRLGDPETQAVLPRLESDLIDVLEGATPVWSETAAVNVVLAAHGYPEGPVTGDVIKGLDGVGDDVLVFHGGTRRDGKRLVVDGGRVLNMVGVGPSIAPGPGEGLCSGLGRELAGNAVPSRYRRRHSVVAVAEHEGDPLRS